MNTLFEYHGLKKTMRQLLENHGKTLIFIKIVKINICFESILLQNSCVEWFHKKPLSKESGLN